MRALVVISRFLCIGLGLLVQALFPPEASAYCRARTDTSRTGLCVESEAPVLYWNRGCLAYVFHDNVFPALTLMSELKVRQTVNTAFAAWVNVDCGSAPFVIEQLAETTDANPVQFVTGVRNEFVISVMSADEWTERGMDPDAFAITYLWYRHRTGEIFDADMALNLSQGQFSDCSQTCREGTIDLQNTVTHEAGHVLGLGHSLVPGATMQSDATAGATFMRSLELDDINGVCSLELPSHVCDDGGNTCRCPPPPILGGGTAGTTCAVSPGRSDRGAWFLLTLTLLGAGYRRRWRASRLPDDLHAVPSGQLALPSRHRST